MRLVKNAKQSWKHYSTVALGVAGGLQGAWATLPDSIKNDLPKSLGQVVAWITLAVLLLGLAGKFVDQTPKAPE